MVYASSGATRWFRPEGEPQFHRCTDADPQSTCGRFRLRHNVDSVRDYAPTDGTACDDCLAGRTATASVTADAVVAKPKAPRAPQKSRAKTKTA